MVILQLAVNSLTHCSIYARYETYVSDSLLIPHIVCNQFRPDPNNSPRLSGKYRVSSPVLFALYWQSDSSRRWYKTAITNTTTASLHPEIVFRSFESDNLRTRWHFVWEDRDEMWRPLNQESWRFCTLEKQGKRMTANRTTGWENGFTSTSLISERHRTLRYPTSSMKSFRTAYTHEHRNWITGEGNDTANACILAAHEKAFACDLEHVTIHVLKRYRTSDFLVFSLHTRTYTKCIWQLELSVRKTSETTAEWFYRGSYILHDGRSWIWYHIVMARVQVEYHCVWSSRKGR